ncbi:hypothetical protein K250101E9_00730 [Enterocloster aldenensis]
MIPFAESKGPPQDMPIDLRKPSAMQQSDRRQRSFDVSLSIVDRGLSAMVGNSDLFRILILPSCTLAMQAADFVPPKSIPA